MASQIQAQEYIEEQQSQEFADEIYRNDEETNDGFDTLTTELDSSKNDKGSKGNTDQPRSSNCRTIWEAQAKETANFKNEKKKS